MKLAAQGGVTDVAYTASKAALLCPTGSHSSQSTMPTFAFLWEVLRMPLASWQVVPHRRNQGTSVQPAGNHPVIKSGALRPPKKPHLSRLDRRYHAFSCVPWWLLQMAGEQTLCRMPMGPVGGTLPPQAGVLLASKAGLAGCWYQQAAQVEPAC